MLSPFEDDLLEVSKYLSMADYKKNFKFLNGTGETYDGIVNIFKLQQEIYKKDLAVSI